MTWDQERARYADKMRKRGTPLLVTPEEFAAAARLLEKARLYGMSDSMIAEQTGVSSTLPSKVRRGAIRTMHRDTLERLSKLHPERPAVSFAPVRGKVGGGAYTGSTGTIRRVQALRADGFPGRILGERLGVSYEAVSQLSRSSRGRVLETTRLSVAGLYEELDGHQPEEFGVTAYAIGKCKTYARRAGYAPRSCWDSDTIDDPEAIPEWTGFCGTPQGHRIHKRDGIPMCPACEFKGSDEPYPGFSGSKLRQLRESKGFSRSGLARAAGGITPFTIQHWESGRSKPVRQNKLDDVLSVLDATLEDVTEQEGQPYGREVQREAVPPAASAGALPPDVQP